MKRPRIFCHGGNVLGNDDEFHYVPAGQVAQLYGVRNFIKWVDGESDRGYRKMPMDFHLYPDQSGKYELPEGLKNGK